MAFSMHRTSIVVGRVRRFVVKGSRGPTGARRHLNTINLHDPTAMKSLRFALVASLVAGLPTPSTAQDFLGSLGRQAAQAAANHFVARAVTRSAPEETAPPSPVTIPVTGTVRGQDVSPVPSDDRAALDRMPEAAREAECARRVPMVNNRRSYEAQIAFGQCMGPRYGDGG